MKVTDLVGSKAWVKQAFGPDSDGYISSIANTGDADNIESAVCLSTFWVDLKSGGIVRMPGWWFAKIQNAEYIRESSKSDPGPLP